jgi:hypothetical protein
MVCGESGVVRVPIRNTSGAGKQGNTQCHAHVGQIAAQTAVNVVGSLVIQAESTEFKTHKFPPTAITPEAKLLSIQYLFIYTVQSFDLSCQFSLLNMSDDRVATANKLAKEIMARPGNEGVDSAWYCIAV